MVRYGFLWGHEAARGATEGRKDRPCAVVLAIRKRDDEIVVVVAPITHSRPDDVETAVELPAAVKRRLGLDADSSWIVTSELNSFVWPGPDLRPIDDVRPARFAYGYLPKRVFDALIQKVRTRARSGAVIRIDREGTT